MVMADLARALPRHVEMDWMAISSYGSGTKSSGVVRILKDLDTDITGRHVLIVDEIIDTGLTLSWLTSNLAQPQPRERRDLHAAAQARGAARCRVDVKYVGWDIPNEFVVGYGLDYRREVPQPARHRHPRAARLQLQSRPVDRVQSARVRRRLRIGLRGSRSVPVRGGQWALAMTCTVVILGNPVLFGRRR